MGHLHVIVVKHHRYEKEIDIRSVSRTKDHRPFSVFLKFSNLSKHLLIDHNLLIDRDEGLLHDLCEYFCQAMVVSRHDPLNDLGCFFLNVLVNLVFIWH
jgi:hypothetical protein